MGIRIRVTDEDLVAETTVLPILFLLMLSLLLQKHFLILLCISILCLMLHATFQHTCNRILGSGKDFKDFYHTVNLQIFMMTYFAIFLFPNYCRSENMCENLIFANIRELVASRIQSSC